MNEKTLMTYSLLNHLKETSLKGYSGIVELFFPIVKKAIYEYAKKYGNYNVKGKSISEIQDKVKDFFEIEIPLSVLDFILSQISKKISDDNVFAYFKDKSFIINAFIFNDIDDNIESEYNNIQILKSDYKEFCQSSNYNFDFIELIDFICSQKIELLAEKTKEELDINYHIPKYITQKFLDKELFKIISDIYLGSLICIYFEFKINSPVSDTELLIDTNFFISLINLNSYEAYLTCNQLFDVGKRLGFKFSILFSTVDQIKYLLNSRIQDFANKDVGLIKETDIFGACIRRNLDKSQLERIKDQVDSLLNKYGIDILYEARIRDLVFEAKKSKKYKEFLEIRNFHKLSALNDTIAFFYVTKKRGDNIQEFADVKCWFLNNTYHRDYYIGIGYKLHERFKINANELLSLLWLANPSQENIDIKVLSKGGLASYIAKFKQTKVPSVNTIRDINIRAKKVLQQGLITEKDVFAISIRMAEGQLTNGDATDLAELPDEDFIKIVKNLTQKDEEILSKVSEQTKLIQKQNELLVDLRQQNINSQFEVALERYEKARDKYVDNNLTQTILKMNKVAWGYLLFVVAIAILWLINYIEFQLLNIKMSGLISFVLFLASLFIRFIEHKSVLKCLRFTFNKNKRKLMLEEFRLIFKNEYNETNKEPVREKFIK